MGTPDLSELATANAGCLEQAGPRPQAHLLELVGRNPGRTYPVIDEVIIGRDVKASVQVPDSDISRSHARICRLGGGEFVLQDLGSRNGTLVNGVPVESRTLSFGDKIKVSEQTIFMFIRHDRLEEQLLQAQKLESIGQIASGVAHDFNNLLSALLINVSYLRGLERFEPAEVRPCLDEMVVAIQQAVELTSQLLAFSRRDAGRGRAVELSEVAEEVIRLIRRIFVDSRIEVLAAVQPGVRIRGDRSQLHQVLMNLCINARDAMPEWGVLRIEISGRRLSATQSSLCPPLTPGEYAVLSVSDGGLGMLEETRLRAFEPFFTTKDPGKGTGLGLAMINGIVKAHGGQIHLESDPDRGTTFQIFLPSVVTTGSTWASSTAERLPGSAPLALLVESDAEARAHGVRLLESLGLEVLTADDAAEVATQLARFGERVRVLFLDPGLPEWDEVLGAVPPAVTCFLTAAPLDGSTAPLPVVPKPFDLERLGQAISHALNRVAPDDE